MTSNLPSRNLQSLEWLEARITAWGDNFASIGLASTTVINLATDLANTRQAFTVTQQIRAESKSKTVDFNAQASATHDTAAGMIHSIKAFADAQENPEIVYALAQISSNAAPTPAAPPSQPIINDYRVLANGSVKIIWEATGPTGTVYNVTRQLAGETEFSYVGQGDSLNKFFVDSTLAAGSTSASYRVQGVRGPLTGPQSGTYTVYFGVGADGEEAAAA